MFEYESVSFSSSFYLKQSHDSATAHTVACGEASRRLPSWSLKLRRRPRLQHLMFQYLLIKKRESKKKGKQGEDCSGSPGLFVVHFSALTQLPETWINRCSLPVLLFSVRWFQLIFYPHPRSTVNFFTHKYVSQRMWWSSMLTSRRSGGHLERASHFKFNTISWLHPTLIRLRHPWALLCFHLSWRLKLAIMSWNLKTSKLSPFLKTMWLWG